MSAPFTSPTISGYNDNPPPDDGSQTEANRVKWSTIKTKLDDPIKTLAEATITNVSTAFAKIVGGGGVTSSAISYQVLSTDQGKLVRITGSGTTTTTPDATVVDDPFWFALVNESGGTITLDGSGSQTVNGAASITIPPAGGGLVATDGTNWFYIGVSSLSVGPGQILNGTISESNAANAVTFAVKTLAGNDPSAGDPVFCCFRNATQATGNYVFRAITSALSLTIPSGATMGASNGVEFDVSFVLFDDGGTIRLGAIVATGVALAKSPPIASSTTIGTSADSANVFYTNTGVTSKAYIPFGVARYPSGLATAGVWNVSPTTLQLFGPDAPAPNGPMYQALTSGTGATYTTPTGCRMLRVRMIGGGGGGGAATTNNGAAGSATSFGSISAAGGSAGLHSGNSGGLGGSGGTGTAFLRVAGCPGAGGGTSNSGGTIAFGGNGGPGIFGTGGGRGVIAAGAGGAAAANSGAGGGGGASGTSAGSGGGAGEYVEFFISGPAASYTYTVGGGGAGGTAGAQAGGAGGSGVILVDEYY